MTLTCRIGHTNIHPGQYVKFKKPGISIKRDLSQAGTLDLTIIDPTVTSIPKYTPIEIFNDGALLYSGFIKQRSKNIVGRPGNWKVFRHCGCIDNRWRAGARKITVDMTNASVQDIAANIVAQLSTEGVTLGTICTKGTYPALDQYPGEDLYPDNDTIPAFQHINEYGDTVIEDLRSKIRAYWYIADSTLGLNMRLPGDETAPWTLTEWDIYRDATVDETNQDYCNNVTIKVWKTKELTEPVNCDGTTRSWTLGYPLATKPLIQVNGELVSNGDCEAAIPTLNGTHGDYQETSSLDTARKHSGTKSAKLVSTNSSASVYVLGTWGNNLNGLTPGLTFKTELWVYVPSSQGILLSDVYLSINDTDGSTEQDTKSVHPSAYDTWILLSVERHLRATSVGAWARLTWKGPVGTFIYMDDVTMGCYPSIGIKGLDEDDPSDFYWNEDDPTITEDSSCPVLQTTDVMVVTYNGKYEDTETYPDSDEILNLASITGMSGIVDRVISDTAANQSEADDLAAATLLMDEDALSLTIKTKRSGLQVGMWQHVQLPSLEIPDDYLLIQQLQIDHQGDESLLYTVTYVKGPLLKDWTLTFSNKAKTT